MSKVSQKIRYPSSVFMVGDLLFQQQEQVCSYLQDHISLN
jgi:hypothetical protein